MLGIPIYSTGIRGGETIIGIGKQNRNTIIQFEEKSNILIYPPSVLGITSLSKTDLSDKFNNIIFFENMSSTERLKWLSENSTKNNDMYLGDVEENFRVKIVKLSGDYMMEHFNNLNINEWYTINELENIIPRKPGSKAKRHTLVFRPSNWALYIETPVENWNGLYIKLFNGDVELNEGKISLDKLNKNTEIKYKISAFENEEIDAPNFAIIFTSRKESYTWDELYKLAPKDFRDDMKLAKQLLEGSYGDTKVNYTTSPAFFKSLLQKIIRFRAKECEVFDEKTSAQGMLLATIGHLLMHPGAFVPNIQRFVSGVESAFKRVAVSICEDAYTDKHSKLLALYCASALAQREKSWIPETELVKTLFTLAIESQQDKRCFKWELGDIYDIDIYENKKKLKDNLELFGCYMVLSHVKSFLSDIQMVSYIAAYKGKTWKKEFKDNFVDSFKVEAAIDHHTNPEILYFFDFERWNLTYPEIIKKIWDISSGFNPRKRDFVDSQELQDIRNAQFLCTLAKYGINEKIHSTRKDYVKNIKFSYTIDKSWLAGLIGPIEIKNCVVVLRVDNLNEFTVIRKPSRDKNIPELTEEEKEEIINKAKELLEKGITIKKCPPSLDKFKDAKVKYNNEDEEYTLQLKDSKKWIDWDECIELEEDLPIFNNDFYNKDKKLHDYIINAIEINNDSMNEKAFEILNEELDKLEARILRRLSTNISGMATKITLPKIGRDGTGIDYTVYNYDTLVFQFLCFVCVILPAALELNKISFNIKNGPLFWSIRDRIEEKIANKNQINEAKIWKVMKEKRKMWEHQQDILKTMIERNENGKRGHLIWLKMGAGKSLIVTEYLRYLFKNRKLPKYVVWALPSSAIDSIEKEVEKAGFKYKLIDSRKGEDQEMKEGVINIVRHDHLRLNEFDEQLKEKANETLFIVDEFHKTMAKGTLRTSITIDIIKLSYDFIGLSGTIVNKSDKTSIDELIVWLQTIVEFEVTYENYFVAIGALLSRKAETHIVINRELIEVEMDENYYKLVPANLGGTATTINFKAAVKMCFDAVREKIIEVTKEYLERGEKVFVVAKDVETQKYIASKLKKYNVFSITNKDTITLGPDDETDIDVVITTVRQAEGYTLSLLRVMISGVYFSSLSTREQLLGRVNRMNSEHESIDFVTVSAGILTYIHEKYEQSRSLHESLKDFAKSINLTGKELREWM